LRLGRSITRKENKMIVALALILLVLALAGGIGIHPLFFLVALLALLLFFGGSRRGTAL
jgi:hypothetical protein